MHDNTIASGVEVSRRNIRLKMLTCLQIKESFAEVIKEIKLDYFYFRALFYKKKITKTNVCFYLVF